MRSRWLVPLVALALALPGSAAGQEAAVDSLALARQYTDWLYAGEADSLFAHTTEEAGQELTAERYAQTSDLIAQRAGFEEDGEETWKLRNGACQYWRTATFTNLDEPFLVRWVLASDGRIAGLGLGPYSQAPPVESETCGAVAEAEE